MTGDACSVDHRPALLPVWGYTHKREGIAVSVWAKAWGLHPSLVNLKRATEALNEKYLLSAFLQPTEVLSRPKPGNPAPLCFSQRPSGSLEMLYVPASQPRQLLAPSDLCCGQGRCLKSRPDTSQASFTLTFKTPTHFPLTRCCTSFLTHLFRHTGLRSLRLPCTFWITFLSNPAGTHKGSSQPLLSPVFHTSPEPGTLCSYIMRE